MAKTRNKSSPHQLRGRYDQDLAAASGTALKSARPDVFVIDDEAGICRFISFTLEAMGLATESFHSAQDALGAMKGSQPAIVFLDVALGDSDAVDVIRSLGELGYTGVVQLMSGNRSSLLNDVHRIGVFHG